MAEFNIVIRKKNENVSLNSDRLTGSDTYSDKYPKPSIVFYDEETDEDTNYSTDYPIKSGLRRNQPETKSGSISSDRTSSSKSEINPKYCPVCFELLEDRVKRVYTKRMEGKVYLPFLDFSDKVNRSKVKLCYSCYKHIVIQWKDYNRNEVPHYERIYKDRNGDFIPSSVEENHARYNKLIGATDHADSTLASEDDHLSTINESNKEMFYIPRKATRQTKNQLDDNFQFLLDEIQEHIGRVEIGTNLNLNKTRREIEKLIEKHSYQVQEELNDLRNDNAYVQHQVSYMRQQIMDIQERRSPRLKRRKKKNNGYESAGKSSQGNNRPFYTG